MSKVYYERLNTAKALNSKQSYLEDFIPEKIIEKAEKH